MEHHGDWLLMQSTNTPLRLRNVHHRGLPYTTPPLSGQREKARGKFLADRTPISLHLFRLENAESATWTPYAGMMESTTAESGQIGEEARGDTGRKAARESLETCH